MWASSIIEPTVVSGTSGSPTIQSPLRSEMRSNNSSSTDRCTMSRELAEQFWPAFQKMPSQMPVAAWSRSSASAITITGLLPPHSRSTSLRFERAEYSRNMRPTSVEPVNPTQSTSGCRPTAAPAVSPKPGTTLKTPSGMPASMANSAIRIVVVEVCSAGLTTQVFPAARIGPIFQPAIMSG